MLFSVASHKLEEFAAQIEDDRARAAIEAAIRHEAYPGPVVCVVGAEGRGKSTLFDRLAGRAFCSDDPVSAARSIRLAYGADWNGLAHPLVRSGGLDEAVPVQRVDGSPAGNVLLIDTPALDTEKGRAVLPNILPRSDLALMAVQITQTSGADEVAFAQEYFRDLPAVLVITKADLADEYDFAEGLQAILQEYGALPWQAMVVSAQTEAGATAEGLQGLAGLGDWWRTEGPHCAAAALRHRRAGLRQHWIAVSRFAIEREDTALGEELGRIGSTLQTNETLRQALGQRQRLGQGLDTTVRQAVGLYGARLRELHPQLINCIEGHLTEDPSALPDPARIAAAWEAALESWDERTRAFLREEMAPAIARLRELHGEFVQCLAQLSVDGASALPVRRETRDGPVGAARDHWSVTVQVPRLDMSLAEWARPGITSALSGLGSAALLNGVGAMLLGPLALPIALIGGLASALCMHGTAASANRRRLHGELRAALERQLPLVQQQLAERYQEDWDRLRDEITLQLAPCEQFLSIYHAAILPDDLSGLRPRYESLANRRQQYAALRRELATLGAPDASEEGERND